MIYRLREVPTPGQTGFAARWDLIPEGRERPEAMVGLMHHDSGRWGARTLDDRLVCSNHGRDPCPHCAAVLEHLERTARSPGPSWR